MHGTMVKIKENGITTGANYELREFREWVSGEKGAGMMLHQMAIHSCHSRHSWWRDLAGRVWGWKWAFWGQKWRKLA